MNALLFFVFLWGSAGAVTSSRYANASTDFVMRATITRATTPPTPSAPQREAFTTRVVLNAAAGPRCRLGALNCSSDLPKSRVYWELRRATQQIVLVREDAAAQRIELKSDPYTPPDPNASSNVTLIRRGTFFLLYLDQDAAGRDVAPDAYVEHPFFDIDCTRFSVGGSEPASVQAGIELTGDADTVSAFSLTAPSSSAGIEQHKRVINHCGPNAPNSSWCFNQVIPGALLVLNGTYYVYVAGQDFDGNDGGGKARIGVAMGPSLDRLELQPGVLLEGTPGAWDERSVFPNGAVVSPDGRVALTYMGQAMDDTWGGIGLAMAGSPLGPFEKHGAPVLSTSPGQNPIHEHTLNRLSNGTYALFYTGFDPSTGDRGFLATSEDLVHWSQFAGNPALPPSAHKSGWDGGHRRPRSLFYYGVHWYLLYEGTNVNRKSTVQNGCWGDTIGLMRSKTLEGPWHDRHPLQIAVPPRPGDAFDSTWTGWPRAHVDAASDTLHVLFSAGGNDFKNSSLHDYASTGLVVFNLTRLTEWTLSF